MMKKILALAVLACASAFAALQFEVQDVGSVPEQAVRYGQPWTSAHQLQITITEGGSLWMANYISNWQDVIPDLATVINMNAGKYGYIDNNGILIGGDGTFKDITFYGVDEATGAEVSNTTKAYFVGDFDAGDSIYFWVTTLDANGGDIGTSNGPVNDWVDPSWEEIQLQSRQHNTVDQAGNTRINFGFLQIGGREFIFAGSDYVGDDGKTGPSGQPLPGVWATLALVGGLMGAKKMKKSKK